MRSFIKSSLLLFTLFLLSYRSECQELQFIHEKTGKVTSFHIGDKVGFGIKNSLFQARDNGTLTGFNENFLLINDKPYEIPQVKYIRHFKPGLSLLFGALAVISSIMAVILGLTLLLGVTPVRIGVLIFGMGIYVISLLTMELINGPRIKPDVHTVKIINEGVTEGTFKMNP